MKKENIKENEKESHRPGVVVHAFNPTRCQQFSINSRLELHSETLSLNK